MLNHLYRSLALLAFTGAVGCTAPGERSTPAPNGGLLHEHLELDHFYTYAPSGVSEECAVAALQEAGLVVIERRFEFPEGGYGRYVHFDNAYLEIHFQDPAVPVSHDDTRRRISWETTGTSPFGIAFRTKGDSAISLPLEMRIDTVRWFGTDGAELAEELRFLGHVTDTLAPALFIVPPSMSYAQPVANLSADARERRRRNRTHRLGELSVAELVLSVPSAGRTGALDLASHVEGIDVVSGDSPVLDIVLISQSAAPDQDLRPTLPIRIRFRPR